MKYILTIFIIFFSTSFVNAEDSLIAIEKYMKDKGTESLEHNLYALNRCTALYMSVSNTMALYEDEGLKESAKQTYELAEVLFRYSLAPYIDLKKVTQEEAQNHTKEIVVSLLGLYSNDMNFKLEQNLDPFYGYILTDVDFCNVIVEQIS